MPNFILISQAVYELSGFQTLKIGHTHVHTHTHTHTSGRQLKITLLDVLDYSDYCDTNISKKCFFTKTASSVRNKKLRFFYTSPFCYLLLKIFNSSSGRSHEHIEEYSFLFFFFVSGDSNLEVSTLA